MPTYCFFDVLEVTDAEKMAQYRRCVLSTIERFDGRYLASGGVSRVVEGDWRPVFPVLLEFPSLEHAERWYGSPEYACFKTLLRQAARVNAVFVEGF